jgi:ribose transport system substrate-binding protein
MMAGALILTGCGGGATEAPAEPAVDEAEKPADQPAPEGAPTIAYSGFSMTNEFWLTLERAAEARAAELGVEFINLTTEVQDAEAQKNAVDSAITQGVDALIIGATDSRGWEDTFDKAEAAGIPVITVDTAIDDPYVSALIQTDNLAAAGLAGDYICEVTGGVGKALVLGGSVGHQTGDARKNGVEEKAIACGLEVISDYSDWDENRSAELTQNTLTANPDLKVVFVAFDPGAAAAMSVVKQKGLLDQVTIVGFDALPVVLKAIAAGEIEATVRQDPGKMGATGVDLALSIINGDTIDAFIPIDGVLITIDNVAEFYTPEGDEEAEAAGDITIAFSGFAMTNEFWLTLERAAEARAGELGVEFINLTTEVQDAEAQKNAVDSAITQGVDALIIGATDSRGWEDTFDKAEAAGIPVITVDTAIDDPYVSALIQTDNLAAARLAGDYFCEVTGGEGKILVLGGSVGHQTGDARKNGVEEQALACGLEVISDYSDWDENRSAELTQNTLTANPDLKGVFVAFDPGAAAAMSVVKQKGMLDQITIVGFDALPVVLKAIAAGEIEATVRQDPGKMGATGVDLAIAIIMGEVVDAFIPIDGILITIDNVADYLTE